MAGYSAVLCIPISGYRVAGYVDYIVRVAGYSAVKPHCMLITATFSRFLCFVGLSPYRMQDDNTVLFSECFSLLHCER